MSMSAKAESPQSQRAGPVRVSVGIPRGLFVGLEQRPDRRTAPAIWPLFESTNSPWGMPTLTRTGPARWLWGDSALADILIEGEEERRSFRQRENAFTDAKRRQGPVLDHVAEDHFLANSV